MSNPAPLIPGYRLGALLHRSAWHDIWRAEREADALPVILKTLHAEYPSRQQAAALEREFRILERLQIAPAVIRVHGLHAWDHGNAALVLESFGTSLAEWAAGQPVRRARSS